MLSDSNSQTNEAIRLSTIFEKPELEQEKFQETKGFFYDFTEQDKKKDFKNTIQVNNTLHAAILENDVEGTILLLKNGANPNGIDELGRTPIHCAAIISSKQVIDILIQNGADVNSKIQKALCRVQSQTQTHSNNSNKPKTGRTPLHIATSQLDFDCINTLLENQADVNCTDDEGMTPLLVAGEKWKSDEDKYNNKQRYEKIVSLVLEWNANANVFSPKTNTGALFAALEFDSVKAFRELIKRGADVSLKDDKGDTILHKICKQGKENFANEIFKISSVENQFQNIVNMKNHEGNTPLHCAALACSRSCLTLLINNGGDLSQTNGSNLTVCDLIFLNVPRALNFFVETLDSKLAPNEYSINDRNFTVTLNFDVLTPNDGQQTSVLIALINTLPYEQKYKIVLHPLISTFIKLKWARLRILFFFLVIIHVMYVLSLSLHVCFLIKGQSMFVYKWSRYVLLFTSAVILIHILTQISLSYKYYLKEFETWLTLTSVSLSSTVGIWETFFMEAPLPPIWIRHVAAYDILLSWILLMFILGRFPIMGYVALMFFTVFKNVIKVLIFFKCLIIGFSLSFCVQFNEMQFDDPWKAFVRTTIMLMGEYEYRELFNDDKIMKRFQENSGNLFITSRIIFLLFILLGSIVLVNLLTGLAVNDIQAIRAEGCLRHMIKQAEFISHIEKISRKKLNRKLVPKRITKILRKMQTLPRIITIRPNLSESKYEVNNKKFKDIPPKLIESIIFSAVKNQKKVLKNISEAILMKDAFDLSVNNRNLWIDTHINDALIDIKHDLQVLSFQLLQVMKNNEIKQG